jgi:hypothetical protein
MCRVYPRAKRHPLLRDVAKMVRLGPDYVDDVAVRFLLGESKIFDADEHVSMENAAALFLVNRDAYKMDLPRRSTATFDGLPKVGDLSGNLSLSLLIRRTAPIGFDREESIQWEPYLPG